jgi:hypothetical protein
VGVYTVERTGNGSVTCRIEVDAEQGALTANQVDERIMRLAGAVDSIFYGLSLDDEG